MSSLRVVVTGAQGQLGFDLISILKNNNQYEVYGFGRQELDITNLKQVKEIMEKNRPRYYYPHSSLYKCRYG